MKQQVMSAMVDEDGASQRDAARTLLHMEDITSSSKKNSPIINTSPTSSATGRTNSRLFLTNVACASVPDVHQLPFMMSTEARKSTNCKSMITPCYLAWTDSVLEDFVERTCKVGPTALALDAMPPSQRVDGPHYSWWHNLFKSGDNRVKIGAWTACSRLDDEHAGAAL